MQLHATMARLREDVAKELEALGQKLKHDGHVHGHKVGELADVDLVTAAPTAGQALVFQPADPEADPPRPRDLWVPGAGGGGGLPPYRWYYEGTHSTSMPSGSEVWVPFDGANVWVNVGPFTLDTDGNGHQILKPPAPGFYVFELRTNINEAAGGRTGYRAMHLMVADDDGSSSAFDQQYQDALQAASPAPARSTVRLVRAVDWKTSVADAFFDRDGFEVSVQQNSGNTRTLGLVIANVYGWPEGA